MYEVPEQPHRAVFPENAGVAVGGGALSVADVLNDLKSEKRPLDIKV